jgi:hypothetical protein
VTIAVVAAVVLFFLYVWWTTPRAARGRSSAYSYDD